MHLYQRGEMIFEKPFRTSLDYSPSSHTFVPEPLQQGLDLNLMAPVRERDSLPGRFAPVFLPQIAKLNLTGSRCKPTRLPLFPRFLGNVKLSHNCHHARQSRGKRRGNDFR
jgi:hypothetical protein